MSIKEFLPVLALLVTLLAVLPEASALSVNLTVPSAGYYSTSKNVTFGCNATDENLTSIAFFLWDSDGNIYYTNTIFYRPVR